MEATSNNWFTNKYPIGYALSGGFIKGFAHLGVMQSLLEHDIKPNILSGVSAGALAGVFYADIDNILLETKTSYTFKFFRKI